MCNILRRIQKFLFFCFHFSYSLLRVLPVLLLSCSSISTSLIKIEGLNCTLNTLDRRYYQNFIQRQRYNIVNLPIHIKIKMPLCVQYTNKRSTKVILLPLLLLYLKGPNIVLNIYQTEDRPRNLQYGEDKIWGLSTSSGVVISLTMLF